MLVCGALSCGNASLELRKVQYMITCGGPCGPRRTSCLENVPTARAVLARCSFFTAPCTALSTTGHETASVQGGRCPRGFPGAWFFPRWSSGGGAQKLYNALDGKLAIRSRQPRLPRDPGQSSSPSCHMALPLPFVIQNQRFARDLRTQLIAFPRHRSRSSSPDELGSTQEASRAHRPLRVPCRLKRVVQSESSSPKHCLLIYIKVSCAAWRNLLLIPIHSGSKGFKHPARDRVAAENNHLTRRKATTKQG